MSLIKCIEQRNTSIVKTAIEKREWKLKIELYVKEQIDRSAKKGRIRLVEKS